MSDVHSEMIMFNLHEQISMGRLEIKNKEFRLWHNHYKEHLHIMYAMMIGAINESELKDKAFGCYSIKKIKVPDYLNFCIFVFKNSKAHRNKNLKLVKPLVEL